MSQQLPQWRTWQGLAGINAIIDFVNGLLRGTLGTALAGLTGDVTATGPGSAVATIGNAKVTLPKIQNATANSRLIGSDENGSGLSYTEVPLGAGLAFTSGVLNTVGGSGGSGNITTTSAFASPPSSPNTGDLWMPSNGVAILRYSGSAWVPWGPTFPSTDPNVSGPSTWVNQGSSTVDAAKGTIALTGAATGSGANVVALVKAAPATPYTITVGLRAAIVNKAFQSYGVLFRDSGSGKIHLFDLACTTSGSTTAAGARVIRSGKWNSATSFSADYQTVAVLESVQFFRIADNGTNRICSMSWDGQHWLQIHSIGRTDFLTADQVGLMVSTENSATPNLAPIVTCFSWLET